MNDKEKFQYRYDIDMQLFGEFNDTFCTINDHMGEIYGYSDLKNWEEIEYKRHIELLEQEVDKRIDAKNKALKYIEDLFKEINLSNQTIVAIRTIERLLERSDEE